jgi:hypothetical protein
MCGHHTLTILDSDSNIYRQLAGYFQTWGFSSLRFFRNLITNQLRYLVFKMRNINGNGNVKLHFSW